MLQDINYIRSRSEMMKTKKPEKERDPEGVYHIEFKRDKEKEKLKSCSYLVIWVASAEDS